VRVWAARVRSAMYEDRDLPPRPVDLEAVEARLRKLEEADRFSGVVAVRQADQGLLSGAFGYASRTWDVPMAPGCASAALRSRRCSPPSRRCSSFEGGAFDLDTSAIEYLGLDGTGISTAVTPYHLLTHTSGIADDAREEAGNVYEDLFRDRPNYAFVETVDFLPQFVGQPPNFAPGTGCRYCTATATTSSDASTSTTRTRSTPGRRERFEERYVARNTSRAPARKLKCCGDQPRNRDCTGSKNRTEAGEPREQCCKPDKEHLCNQDQDPGA
jgi:hypothetical protein